jgi:hypothetical protein
MSAMEQLPLTAGAENVPAGHTSPPLEQPPAGARAARRCERCTHVITGDTHAVKVAGALLFLCAKCAKATP